MSSADYKLTFACEHEARSFYIDYLLSESEGKSEIKSENVRTGRSTEVDTAKVGYILHTNQGAHQAGSSYPGFCGVK